MLLVCEIRDDEPETSKIWDFPHFTTAEEWQAWLKEKVGGTFTRASDQMDQGGWKPYNYLGLDQDTGIRIFLVREIRTTPVTEEVAAA